MSEARECGCDSVWSGSSVVAAQGSTALLGVEGDAACQ